MNLVVNELLTTKPNSENYGLHSIFTLFFSLILHTLMNGAKGKGPQSPTFNYTNIHTITNAYHPKKRESIFIHY